MQKFGIVIRKKQIFNCIFFLMTQSGMGDGRGKRETGRERGDEGVRGRGERGEEGKP